MIHILVFNIVQLVVALYAFRRGGAPERWVAAMMLVANVATAIRPYDPAVSFDGLDRALFAIDAMLLVGFAAIAVRANRYWPMWLAALQLDGIAIHALRAVDGAIVPLVYAWATGQIAYPMMVLLVAGTMRHRRRLLALGTDPDWTHDERQPAERWAHGPLG